MRGCTRRDWDLYIVERRRLEIVLIGAAYMAQSKRTPAELQHAIQEVIAKLGVLKLDDAIAWVAAGRPSLSRRLVVRSV